LGRPNCFVSKQMLWHECKMKAAEFIWGKKNVHSGRNSFELKSSEPALGPWNWNEKKKLSYRREAAATVFVVETLNCSYTGNSRSLKMYQSKAWVSHGFTFAFRSNYSLSLAVSAQYRNVTDT